MQAARVGADGPPCRPGRNLCPLHTQPRQGSASSLLPPLRYGASAGEPGTVPVAPNTALFVEVFAGRLGRLSGAIRAMGIQTAEPQDLLTGGLDLLKPTDIAKLFSQLRAWASLGV